VKPRGSLIRICAAALLGACGEAAGPQGPAPVATIAVTSPIGALWDVGGTTQLAATPRDAQGNPVGGVTLVWSSSAPLTVSVSPTGAIQALAVGSATIRAEAGSVSGTLAVQVVDADLAGIVATASDAYVAALVLATTAPVRTRLQTAAAACVAAAGQGNLQAIQACIAAVRTEAAGATDPTDRALLAVLNLFADQLDRLLND
jgi:hypothetical protein